MSELLPSVQAADVQAALLDYLTTTFALADDEASRALTEFLSDPVDGIFKGPYLRLRLPFAPAQEGWRDALDWYAGPTPYGHQAEAFRRLTTVSAPGEPERRPQPTLVTTGTGSGKTEAFLFPILDHVLRAKAAGVTGMKALILYPMNALANDQARRLTDLILGRPELNGVTAGLYTGEGASRRTRVTEDGLITDRAILRSQAPDILLTNYKMLDHMLLREEDASLWAQSATSLRYLVLDEFHTYDGAQGTDVSMLLRRLGLALKSHWRDDDPVVTDDDRARPLGRMTPVATSATLGDSGDPTAMLGFAETVFGEPFGPDAAITESRLSVDEWIGAAADRTATLGYAPATVDATVIQGLDSHAANATEVDSRHLTAAVMSTLYDKPIEDLTAASPELLSDLVKAHPLVRLLVERSSPDAVSLEALATAVLETLPSVPGGTKFRDSANGAVVALAAALSHVRAVAGRGALTVELHQWIRELTRIDRTAADTTIFRWSDDGELSTAAGDDRVSAPFFPAVYCRLCGRSGWGVALAPTGSTLDMDDDTIRAKSAAKDERFRALIHAPEEGELALARRGADEADNLMWFEPRERRLVSATPSDDERLRSGGIVPVLVHRGTDAGKSSASDVCPSCQQRDGIRFVGSAIATLLSVALSSVFGSGELDPREKRAIVFTDSVQDAAHRAGFVESRSYSLTLRSLLRDAVDDAPVALDVLVDRVIARAGDSARRYRMLPPGLADRDPFVPFWEEPAPGSVPAPVLRRVRLRLLLDAVLEFGLQSRVGRTLELTASLSAEVEADPDAMTATGYAALRAFGGTVDQPEGIQAPASVVTAWVRGFLLRMRVRGAIDHEWFRRYQDDDGRRYSIWGGRPKHDGMPAFPRGRAAPGYPRIGGPKLTVETDLDPVTSPQSWYSHWTSRTLGVPRQQASVLARLLFDHMAKADLVRTRTAKDGAVLHHVPPERIVVSPVELAEAQPGRLMLGCDVCQDLVPVTWRVHRELDGAPCLVVRCPGHLRSRPVEDNFYRRMYAAKDIQRVIAREHTGLLDDTTRLMYENEFKKPVPAPDAPNVLVATPTLEMGIDIGDLSMVMLASLPRAVANYVQRVGRAGRLTGNAYCLSFVTGRGENLPRIGDPLSMINGAVRPPATYLDAEEILRRQLLAYLADGVARSGVGANPRNAIEALGSTDSGSYLHAVMSSATPDSVDAFLDAFDGLGDVARQRLRAWALEGDGTTTPLARRLHDESRRWSREVETLSFRLKEIEKGLPELKQRALLPAASDDDKRDFRTAEAERGLTRHELAELRGEYWVSVLERFGIFPNYSLIDDSVTLDVALSWVNEEGEYETEEQSYQRGSASALTEFAPGTTFYARGYAIDIDAVDLGHQGAAITGWVLCPDCGFVNEEAGEPKPSSCPRCGSVGITDTGQRLQVVELERVTAAVRRDDAVINDSDDERRRQGFTVAASADVDPAKVVRQWFVEGYPFGTRYLRDMTIRWMNLGAQRSPGGRRMVSGAELTAPLFRVCASCGQRDTATQSNRRSEHRPWCPLRNAIEEDVRTIALARTLRTEGLLVRLPRSVSWGDPYAVPSLEAAILLGLRERIGGAPDHLQVIHTVDPVLSDGTDNQDALLLHDVVPGGTGYLAELSDPEQVWAVLHRAWVVVRDCPCQDEERAACHRCLLPFGRGRDRRLLSRAAAERHLRAILSEGAGDAPSDEMSWACSAEEPVRESEESHIEQRFRKVLRDRLENVGATIRESPTSRGNRMTITVAGSGNVWTLDPQQHVLSSMPDFVLRSSAPGMPEVVVFTDGWRYHASAAHNRLADDAEKRELLRESGRVVLGVSWEDLDRAEAKVSPPAPWIQQANLPVMTAQAGITKQTVDHLTSGPVDFLVGWILKSGADELAAFANWLPYFVIDQSGGLFQATNSSRPLSEVALGILDGKGVGPQGEAATWAWRAPGIVLVSRTADNGGLATDVAVVIDDRSEALDDDHAEGWREWLRIANVLNLRDRPALITTTSRVLGGAAPMSAPELSLPEGWDDVVVDSPLEKELVNRLAKLPFVPKPTVGYEESTFGIPLTVSWPDRRIVLDVELEEQDRLELADDGWTIVSDDPDSLRSVFAGEQS